MMCQKAVLLLEFRYVYCIGGEDIFMGEVKEKELTGALQFQFCGIAVRISRKTCLNA